MFFLGIKLFFVFQDRKLKHLFEIEFRETSQNFNSFSSFKQSLFSSFLSVVWLSWSFVRFHEILFRTDAVLFLKKYFLSPCQYQNKKALFTDPIFSKVFGLYYCNYVYNMWWSCYCTCFWFTLRGAYTLMF